MPTRPFKRSRRENPFLSCCSLMTLVSSVANRYSSLPCKESFNTVITRSRECHYRHQPKWLDQVFVDDDIAALHRCAGLYPGKRWIGQVKHPQKYHAQN